MKKNLKQLATFFLGWPLSLIALFFIFRTFSPKLNEILQNIQSLNIPLLLIGILCFTCYYGFRSIIWHFLLKNMGYTIPFHETAFHWASSEFKRYIPGNIWSFVGRSVVFTEKGMSKKDIARALIFEQELVLLGCIFITFLGVPFLGKHLFPFLTTIPFLTQLCLTLPLFLAGLYIIMPKFTNKLPPKPQTILQHLLPNFPPDQTFWLLFISAAAFLCFGLGYYFSISAFAFLNLQEIWALSGFFVFSLLIGLFSFITPTGLGVREGMITFGLSKVIPLNIAGFVSLAGRIVLVLSEIIFLIISYCIYRLKNIAIIRYIKEHKHETTLTLLIVLFSAYFIAVSMLRHENFYTGRFDLGNMDQTVWNTAHGRIFEFTNPDGTEIVSRLAFHADVILIFLAPLYLIWESPHVLLIVQTVVVGLGAVFMYLLTLDVFRFLQNDKQTKLLALALSFSYLLNPALQRATIYDFHAVTLATTFLLGAFYFMRKEKYGWFILFVILAGITKEQIWFITGLFGVYLLLRALYIQYIKTDEETKTVHLEITQKDKLRNTFLIGIVTTVASAGIFYMLIWHAIPTAGAKTQHFALSYFAEANDSPTALVKNALFAPDKTFEKITEKGRMNYMKKMLLPVGYLPVVAPWYLIYPSADIMLNMLSDKPQLHQIYYQYTAAITPFLFIAALYAVSYGKRLFPSIPLPLYTVYILVMAMYGAYLYGPLPGSREPNLAMFTKPAANKVYIMQALRSLDPTLSVSASNSLGAHLTHRRYLYTLPYGVDTADIVVFNLKSSYNQPSNDWHRQKVEELRLNPNYEILADKEGFTVFKKKY